MSTRLEAEADAILRRSSRLKDREMVYLRYKTAEVFRPFDVPKYRGTLSGPVPRRSFCAQCRGPKRWGEELCRGCAQKAHLREFATVMEYWLSIWRQITPDFSPRLIETIDRRERLRGPAAFWFREESVL